MQTEKWNRERVLAVLVQLIRVIEQGSRIHEIIDDHILIKQRRKEFQGT